jgi:hypothetical protein
MPCAGRSASRAKFKGECLPLLLFLYAWAWQVKGKTLHWLLSVGAAHLSLDVYKEQRQQQNQCDL